MTDIETPVLPARGGNALTGLVRAARPKQWVKNVLVFAAPFAGARITEFDVLVDVAIAFGAFCLAASATYLLNDSLDVEADRSHPRKRNRPIASGLVPVPLALGTAALLAAAALALSVLASTSLTIVVAVYLAVQAAYCLWLKHEPVLDVAIVSSGFLLRAVAGGVAAGIVLSQWFLLTAAFGSLFMAAGKRYAEKKLAMASAREIRPVLHRYTDTYLRFMWTLSATVLVIVYCLWAFDITVAAHSVWAPVSIVPFVLAVLRYAIDVDDARAGEPEEVALGDRVLQVLALLWVVALAIGLYL